MLAASDMIWIGIVACVGLALALLWASRKKDTNEKIGPKPVDKKTTDEDEDDAVEITLVRALPAELMKKPAAAAAGAPLAVPPLDDEEEGEADAAPRSSTTTAFYPDDEPEAAVDEPTQPATRFLVSACGQSDRGLTRRRNEDSFLMAGEKEVFVVADGMGGYAGGKVASELAVETLREVFEADKIDAPLDKSVPRRGAEIAWAVQKANGAIFERAQADAALAQMGTTVVAARFSANKQRAYVAHVGDSRAYRFRSGKLRRLTTDHTMRELGFSGKGSEQLYRAVGIAPTVDVDLIIDKPRPDDVYLLCSDGLTKMATDENIETIIAENVDDVEAAAYCLIEVANDHGGKDNVTCIVVKVVERLPTITHPPEETVDGD
jgi:protein phosphatase